MQLRADRGGLGPSSCIAGQIAVQPGPGAPSGASVPWLQHGFSAGTRSRPRPLSPCARSSRHPSHVDFFAGDRPRTLNTPQPCWQAVSFSLPPIARWVPSPAAPALPHSSHPRTHAHAPPPRPAPRPHPPPLPTPPSPPPPPRRPRARPLLTVVVVVHVEVVVVVADDGGDAGRRRCRRRPDRRRCRRRRRHSCRAPLFSGTALFSAIAS